MKILKHYLKSAFFRLIGGLFIVLPLRYSLRAGKFLGNMGYCFDIRHRNIAYRNLRIAFSSSKTPDELNKILKSCFINLCQSFIEMLSLPKIDRGYLDKFIEIEGLEYIDANIKEGRGVILLASHFGSWELAMSVCPILGYPFSVIVQTQRDTYLNHLLNSYRRSKGYKLIPVRNSMREVITDLKSGRVLGIVADHGGGKEGRLVDFLGHPASTPTGAVKFARKLGLPLMMVYARRIEGGRHKIVLSAPLKLVEDMDANLISINKYIQGYITRNPEQYLWFYRRWKYSNKRNILLLWDGKAGHLRQSEALIKAAMDGKRWNIEVRKVEVEYRNQAAKRLLPFLAPFAFLGLFARNWIMRSCVSAGTYREIISFYSDMVISAGSSLAPVNLLISRENLAKSVCVMKPGILSFRRFNLVVVPLHDNPARLKNAVITDGALNTIDDVYINDCGRNLITKIPAVNLPDNGKFIGVLLGGDTKDYALAVEPLAALMGKAGHFARQNAYKILFTTSRRTPAAAVEYVKHNCFNDSAYALVIIANENNFEGAVGGILGLSRVIICSADSISMISEAVSSGRGVLVFGAPEVKNKRHSRFLRNLESKGYITLVSPGNIEGVIAKVTGRDFTSRPLRDMDKAGDEICRLLG